jgi:outer membrane protein TolC
LLPTLNLVGTYGGNGLAGTVVPCNPASFFCRSSGDIGPLKGGFSRAFTNVIQGNYPNYSLGFNLQIPIHNRSAQADVIRTQLELKQTQLTEQQLQNQIAIEVRNAQYSLQQYHAAIAAARDAVQYNR